ncbi:hypothetical protein, partial [Cyclobacterium roseum]|uniref:hypothetical protein n=1 Tax=Cyclobacterium roseum TaxID=2666137 RepID=UPI0013916CB0
TDISTNAGDISTLNTEVSQNTTDISTNASNIALKENSANKSTDGTLADGTDTKFPTEKAVKTYVDGKVIELTSNVTGILPVANGGTGSATQNFVDLTTDQTIAGNKTISGVTNVSNTTESTTITTGALVINGGVGVTKNLNVGGTIRTGAVTYTNTDGTNGQVLMTDGSGVTSWSNPTATVIEVADEFSATASQTSFTLTQAPSANSKVKMYVNGIRISNTAYSWSGTTLTYVPANNGGNSLTAGDRIQMDYSY